MENITEEQALNLDRNKTKPADKILLKHMKHS